MKANRTEGVVVTEPNMEPTGSLAEEADRILRQRQKGSVVVTRPEEPTGVLAEEAKKINREKQDERAARAERRAEREVPNYFCYPEAFKGFDPKTHRWADGSRKLPKCRVCECTLFPMENHKCSGFAAKFKEHTKESHERWEAKREEIRESRRLDAGVFCSVCGEHMEDPEDGQWHWDAHEGRPEREHYAIDGEPEGDLDGYDDEPEDDYCEGDDDGWDCD